MCIKTARSHVPSIYFAHHLISNKPYCIYVMEYSYIQYILVIRHLSDGTPSSSSATNIIFQINGPHLHRMKLSNISVRDALRRVPTSNAVCCPNGLGFVAMTMTRLNSVGARGSMISCPLYVVCVQRRRFCMNNDNAIKFTLTF